MTIPQFMIDNPNWMNTPDVGETVFVQYAGQIHSTHNGIHLGRWLRDGAQIVPDPDAPAPVEEKPAEEAPQSGKAAA